MLFEYSECRNKICIQYHPSNKTFWRHFYYDVYIPYLEFKDGELWCVCPHCSHWDFGSDTLANNKDMETTICSICGKLYNELNVSPLKQVINRVRLNNIMEYSNNYKCNSLRQSLITAGRVIYLNEILNKIIGR